MVDENAARWADALYGVSLLKQEKVRQIASLLPDLKRRVCLDVGGDNGVVSLMFRRMGGSWSSADLDHESVEAIRAVVGESVCLVLDAHLPFDDSVFDCVVLADCVEHVVDDHLFVREAERVLAPGGALIINVPRATDGLLRRLRLALGQTDARHGHVRPGYSREDIETLLSDAMAIDGARTYSRFFTQLVDVAVVAVVRLVGVGRHTTKGTVVTQDASAASLRSARWVYPIMWLFSRLDRLLWFTKGHMLVVRATKSGATSSMGGGA